MWVCFFQELQAVPNGRKRPIEVDDVLPTRGTDMVGNMPASNEWKKTKRNKASTSEQQYWQHEVMRGSSTHIQEHTVSDQFICLKII
jgi:hypothetical protein